MSDIQALHASLTGCLVFETTSDGPVGKETQHLEDLKCLTEDQKPQFGKLLQKGSVLRQMMLVDDHQAGQMFNPSQDSAESVFLEVDDLERWGYVDTSFESQPTLVSVSIGNVLRTIGLDPDSSEEFGDNFAINHEHIQDAVVGKKYYPPTKALFYQVINPGEGLIVAYDNRSPMEALLEAGIDDARAPDLKFWSDIAYLQWESWASDNSDLQYVLRYNVLNRPTNFVVDTINNHNNSMTDEWPGNTYEADSPEGQALLGTPNGSGVAYLLIQHKKQLGHKTVEKITIFRKGRELMLLFHIGGVFK